MIIALTLLILSLGISAFILWNKKREVEYGEPLLKIGNEKMDQTVYDTTELVIYTATHASVNSTKRIFRKAVISVEKQIITIYRIITDRFINIGDMVTGKSVPKNKGSVSFFLKNVERYK
jgi:hypothetical protein